MSDAHEEGHRRILRALVAAGNGTRAAFDASDLATCGRCRQELDGMLALVATLESVGEDERSSLRDAEAFADPVLEARLRSRMERYIKVYPASGPKPMQARKVRQLLVAAAAVLLIGLTGSWLWRRPLGAPSDPWLGGQTYERVPRGEVADFARFQWEVRLPERGWFVVRVYDGAVPGPSEEISASGPLRAQQWLPSEAETERWGERIRWRLELYDGSSDVPQASWVEEAWRSSPR